METNVSNRTNRKEGIEIVWVLVKNGRIKKNYFFNLGWKVIGEDRGTT